MLLIALWFAQVGCTPRSPKREPGAVPAKQPSPPAAPQVPPANAEVKRALASATDLFNRGENDLACDQVAAAEQIQRQAAAASPSAPAPADLERYRQACQTP